MKTDYRLIQVIESRDNVTEREISIFELTPVEYHGNGFSFNPYPSVNNHFYVFLQSEQMDGYFLSDPERIITLELANGKYIKKLVKTPEGIRSTYFSHELFWMRFDPWFRGAKRFHLNGEVLQFNFTHFESADFTYGNTFHEVNQIETSESVLYKVSASLIVKDKFLSFSASNDTGIEIKMETEILNVAYTPPGLQNISYFVTRCKEGLFENHKIVFRFDFIPEGELNWSDRSLTVTIRGNEGEPFIKHQMSFMFGEFSLPNFKRGEIPKSDNI